MTIELACLVAWCAICGIAWLDAREWGPLKQKQKGEALVFIGPHCILCAFQHHPAEKQTRDYPGAPEFVELTDAWYSDENQTKRGRMPPEALDIIKVSLEALVLEDMA